MKVTAICPNCNVEILINGIKFVYDNNGSKGLGGAIRSYIGWNDKKNKAPPSTPPKDDTKEFEQVLDSAIKKSPPPTDDTVVAPNKQLGTTNLDTINIRPTPTITVGSQTTLPTNSPSIIVGPGAATIKETKTDNLPDVIHVDNTKEEARDILKKMAEQPTKINKPIKLPEDNIIQSKPTDINLSTSTIDAIGREIAKRISEFKAKGICLICNVNQGSKENLICDKCLQDMVTKKVREEHKEEEKKSLIW